MAQWLLVFLITVCGAEAWPQIALYDSLGGRRLEPGVTDQQIQDLQGRARKTPDDYAVHDKLGAAFFQKARETGDVAYYDLAEKALKRALSLVPQDFRAADPLVHIALVYMGEHRFSDALSSTRKAIGLGSGSLAAFAIEGDAYTDMGDYDQAAAAYHAMQILGRATASPLTVAYMSDSRVAYLAFLHGDTGEAIRLMKSAITAALQSNVPEENLAWLYFELGERFFQSGDLANAESSYQSGIAVDPDHYRCLAGLAKVRAAQGKLEESIRLYRRSTAIVPSPVYVEELAEVYQQGGRLGEAQRQWDLIEYIGKLNQLNQVLANRELALFDAEQGIRLPDALKLAAKELEVRHDIYTWDTLAWVLYKNGRLQEATEAIDKALGLHTNDSLLLFHAGMIYHAQARDSQAENFLKHALKSNPHFHIFHAAAASRTLEEIAESRRQPMQSGGTRNGDSGSMNAAR